MSTQNHQITKRELIEMLEPFDDHDKVGVRATIKTEDDLLKSVDLLVENATRENTERTTLVINAYEA